MTFKKRKTRNGRPSDIAKLDVHDWLGNIMHRLRGKTTDKKMGVAILNTVKDIFGLTEQDIIEITDDMNQVDLENHRKEVLERERQEAKERLRRDINRPIDLKKERFF